jgi:hypothetical protein
MLAQTGETRSGGLINIVAIGTGRVWSCINIFFQLKIFHRWHLAQFFSNKSVFPEDPTYVVSFPSSSENMRVAIEVGGTAVEGNPAVPPFGRAACGKTLFERDCTKVSAICCLNGWPHLFADGTAETPRLQRHLGAQRQRSPAISLSPYQTTFLLQ